MEYIKKPIPVQAQRIQQDVPFAPWLQPYFDSDEILRTGSDPVTYAVRTNHGPVIAQLGDWILQSPDGEVYPCANDTFLATYEPVSPPSSNSNLKASPA